MALSSVFRLSALKETASAAWRDVQLHGTASAGHAVSYATHKALRTANYLKDKQTARVTGLLGQYSGIMLIVNGLAQKDPFYIISGGCAITGSTAVLVWGKNKSKNEDGSDAQDQKFTFLQNLKSPHKRPFEFNALFAVPILTCFLPASIAIQDLDVAVTLSELYERLPDFNLNDLFSDNAENSLIRFKLWGEQVGLNGEFLTALIDYAALGIIYGVNEHTPEQIEALRQKRIDAGRNPDAVQYQVTDFVRENPMFTASGIIMQAGLIPWVAQAMMYDDPAIRSGLLASAAGFAVTNAFMGWNRKRTSDAPEISTEPDAPAPATASSAADFSHTTPTPS